MSNIQQLRKLAVKLSATGTAEQVSAPFRLYKNSYGFVLIQCYVPVTQNTTHAPLCTVYKTSINLAGERIKGEGNYNLTLFGEVVLDGFRYLVFENPMPREFTDTEGDLEITFNYADTDGQGRALDQLPSNILNLYVEGGGWNDEGVVLDITSQEAAQINQNTIDIELLRQGQDDFIKNAEELIENAETAIENFIDEEFVTDANFVVVDSTTLAQLKTLNPKTNIESTITKSMPISTAENDGLQSKADVIAIQNLNGRVSALENRSLSYPVTIPENPTQEQLQALFETAADAIEVPDGTVLIDTAQNISYQFFVSRGLWELILSPGPGQWTNETLGLGKGSTKPGQFYAENDGTGSVNGWDESQANINNIQNLATNNKNLIDNINEYVSTVRKFTYNCNGINDNEIISQKVTDFFYEFGEYENKGLLSLEIDVVGKVGITEMPIIRDHAEIAAYFYFGIRDYDYPEGMSYSNKSVHINWGNATINKSNYFDAPDYPDYVFFSNYGCRVYFHNLTMKANIFIGNNNEIRFIDCNLTGSINFGDRPIGQKIRGFGEIAQGGSGSTTDGNRFLANLVLTYNGNRRWTLRGAGKVLGTNWPANPQNGLSFSKIATALNLPTTFFNNTGIQIYGGGNWTAWRSDGSIYGTRDYGTCFDALSAPNRLVFARVYSTSGGVGGLPNVDIFLDNAYIEFTLDLVATAD